MDENEEIVTNDNNFKIIKIGDENVCINLNLIAFVKIDGTRVNIYYNKDEILTIYQGNDTESVYESFLEEYLNVTIEDDTDDTDDTDDSDDENDDSNL